MSGMTKIGSTIYQGVMSITEEWSNQSKQPVFTKEASKKEVERYQRELDEILLNDTPQQLKQLIQEHSFLTSSPAYDLNSENACDLSLQLTKNDTLKRRCDTFKAETKDFDLFAQQIKEAKNNPDKQAALYENLCAKQQQREVIWLPLNEEKSMICRVDADTFSIINISKTKMRFHETVSFTEKDPLTGDVNYSLKGMLVKTFRRPKQSPVSEVSFFKALLRPHFFSTSDAYFYQNFVQYNALTEVSRTHLNTHQHRFFSLKEESDALSVVLFYALTGTFEASNQECKEGGLLYCKHAYLKKRQALVKQVNGLLDTTEGLEKLTQRLAALIQEAKSLLDEKMIEAEELKKVYATYLDVQQRKLHLNVIHEQQAHHLRKEAINLKVDPSDKNTKSLVIHKPVSLTTDPLHKKVSVDPIDQENLVKRVESAIQESVHSLRDLSFDSVDPLQALEQAHKQLQEVASFFEENPYSQAQYLRLAEEMSEYLNKLLKSLPIPSEELTNFWSQSSHRENILKTIDDFSHTLLRLGAVNSAEGEYSLNQDPRFYLCHYQLLSIADFLSRKDANNRLNGFQLYYHDYLYFLKNSSLVLDDYSLQKRAREIAQYFDPQFSYEKLHQQTLDTRELRFESIMGLSTSFHANEGQFTFLEDSNDANSQTYTYYKGFIDYAPVLEYWKKLGKEAPKTEKEKVLWILQEAITGSDILPKDVYVLQRLILRLRAQDEFLPVENTCFVKGSFQTETKEKKKFLGVIKKSLAVGVMELKPEHSALPIENLSWISRLSNQLRNRSNSTLYFSDQGSIYFNRARGVRYERPDKQLNITPELAQIQCNPFDSVNRLISYYTQHLSLLKEQAHQNFFLDSLFQFNRLEIQLEAQPYFVLALEQFFKDSIQEMLLKEDYATANFLFQSANQVQRFLSSLREEHSHLFPADHKQIEMEKWLIQEVIPQANSQKELACLHACLLNYYDSNQLFQQRCEQAAMSYATLTAMTAQSVDTIKTTDLTCKAEIISYIQQTPAIQKAILDELSKLFNLSIETNRYKVWVDEHLISSADYTFNLYTGEIFEKDIPILQSVDKVMHAFKDIYGISWEEIIGENNEDKYVFKQVKGLYVWQPKEAFKHLPTFRMDSRGTVERQYQDKMQRLMRKADRYFLTRTYSDLFLDDDRYWYSEESYKQESWFGKVQIQTDRSIEVESSKNKKTLVQLQPLEMEVSSKFEEFKVVSIHREGLKLVEKEAISSDLKHIFDNIKAEYWIDPVQNIVKKIFFHESGLSFTVNQNRQIACNNFEGYFLTRSNSLSNQLSKPVLTLINSQGQVKHLISKEKGFSHTWIEVNEIEGQLVGSNRLAQLSLACLFSNQGKYKEAFQCLQNISSTREYTEQEHYLIKNLAPMASSSAANTLWLKAHCLEIESSIFCDRKSDSHSNSFLEEKYLAYLYQSGVDAELTLTEEDEELILQALIKHRETFIRCVSKFAVWEYYESSRKLALYRERLAILQGSNKAAVGVAPLLRKTTDRLFTPSISAEYLFDQLDSAFGNTAEIPTREFIYHYIHAQKIDESNPPSIDSIQDNFFIYYSFICEIATADQRKQFAKSLELCKGVASYHTDALIDLLQKLCRHPSGRPTLAKLVHLYRRNIKLSEVDPKQRDYKQYLFNDLHLWLHLKAIVRFHLLGDASAAVIKVAQLVQQTASAMWRSSFSRTSIKGRVIPWARPYQKDPQMAYQLSSIDSTFDASYQELVNRYFIKQEFPQNTQRIDVPVKEGKTAVDQWTNETIRSYTSFVNQPTSNELYRWKSHTGFQSLHLAIQALEKEAKSAKAKLKTELQELVRKANAGEESDNSWVTRAIRHSLGRDLSADQLFALFANSTEEHFMDQTAFKDPECFRKFLLVLTKHYIEVSRLQQLENTIELLKKSQKPNQHSDDQALYWHQAAQCLLAKPAYTRTTGRKERGMLAQEVGLKLLARPDQVKKLEEILQKGIKHPELLVEAPLGWGKSQYFRPLMSHLKADGKTYVINLVPSVQELTLTDELEQRMNLCFGKKITRMIARRDLDFSLEDLERIDRRIEQRMKRTSGNIEIAQAEAYQALELQFLLLCHHANPSNPWSYEYDCKKIAMYQKILRRLRVDGWAAIEEEHEVINNRNKLIFAIGDKSSYSPRYSSLVSEIIRCILEDQELNELFKIQQNQQESVTSEDIINRLLPKLVAHFSALYELSESDTHMLHRFLLAAKDDPQEKEIMRWAENHENRDRFALLKGMIHVCLKVACKGRINAKDGYALSKRDPKLKVPIPYLGKDTPKETAQGSSHNHPDVAILRSFFYYQAKGLTQAEVVKMIERMREDAQIQAQGENIEATSIAQDFHQLVSVVGLDPSFLKLSSKNKDLKKLVEKLVSNPTAINYYVQYVVAPQIESYSLTIESSTQNLRSMFGASLSMSATPQQAAAHGPKTVFVPMEGTSGGISHILLNKSGTGNVRLNIVQDLEEEQALQASARDALAKGAAAVVESTPGFTLSNQDIAKIYGQALSGQSRFEGVLFCDEKDKTFKVYNKAGIVQSLDQSGLDVEDLFKFYSHEEAFNTDWKSAISAYFKILIGPNTTWEQAGQAAGRARLVHLLQTIGFEIRQETLNKHFEGKTALTPLDMFYFLCTNSAVKQASNDYISLFDQMQNTHRRALLDKMLGLSLNRARWDKDKTKEPDPKNAIKVFQSNQQVFISHHKQDRWEMYGGLRQGCDPAQQLTDYQTKCILEVGKTKKLGFFEKRGLQKELGDFTSKWKGENRVLLPDTVEGYCENVNAHVEILRETRATREIEPDLCQSVRYHSYSSDTYAPNIDLFQKGWETPSLWKRTAYKVFACVGKVFNKIADTVFNTCLPLTPIAFYGSLFVASITDGAFIPLVAFGAVLAGVIAEFGLLFASVVISETATLCRWVVQITNRHCVNHYVKHVVNDAVSRKAKRASRMFGYDYLISNNKLKIWTGGRSNTDSQQPFQGDAKPLLQLLIILDKLENGQEKLTVIDIDANDSKYFYGRLLEDKKTSVEEAQKRTRQIAIYDVEAEYRETPQSRFLAMSKNEIEIEKLLKTPAFHAAVAQAKLYNGYLKFSNEQLQEVTNLVSKIGERYLENGKIAENFYYGEALRPRFNKKNYFKMPVSRILNPIKAATTTA